MVNLEVLGSTITSIAGDAILDSGTNVLLLDQQPYTDIANAFKSSCAAGSGLHGVCDVAAGSTIFDGACYAYTASQLLALPNLTLNLANTTLSIPASAYMNLYDPLGPNPDYYCLGLRVSSAGFIIGGTNTQTGVDRRGRWAGGRELNSDGAGERVTRCRDAHSCRLCSCKLSTPALPSAVQM